MLLRLPPLSLVRRWRREPVGARETFSALKACQQAVRIGRAVACSDPAELTHVQCPRCGTWVDCREFPEERVVACPECNWFVDVPTYMVGPSLAHEKLEEPRRRFRRPHVPPLLTDIAILVALAFIVWISMILLYKFS